MAVVKTEVTFMVYRQNGTGKLETRIMDLTAQDYIACTSSNRRKNPKLLAWGLSLFPSAKEVKIQSVKEYKEKKVFKKKDKKQVKETKSIFRAPYLFVPFRLLYWILKLLGKISRLINSV